MPYFDPHEIPTDASGCRSQAEWPTEAPDLRLEPWYDPYQEGQAQSRFGGYERQIEAQVLQSLSRLPG